MKKTLKGAFISRYGGEEFIVVVNKDNAYESLESLRKAIENEVIEFEGHKHQITITIGTTSYKKEISLEKWIELADEKMYSGKNSGKNKTVI